MSDSITLDRSTTQMPSDETLARFDDSEFGHDLQQLVRSTARACSEEVFEPRLCDALKQTRLTVGKAGQRLDARLQRVSAGLDDLLKCAKQADKEQQFRLLQLETQLPTLQRELLDLSRECAGRGKKLEDQLVKLGCQQREADAALTRQQSEANAAFTRQQSEADAKLLNVIAELQRDVARAIGNVVRISRAQFWVLLGTLLISDACLLAALFLRK